MTINFETLSNSQPAVVELFTLHQFDPLDLNAKFRFANIGNVAWKGEQYIGLSCKGTGFGLSGQEIPRPRLKVANVHGMLGAIIEQYQDLVGAKLTRTVTLEKYLDGFPTADALQEFSTDTWTIEQKLSDNALEIEWELSFAGIENLIIPRRRFLDDFCDGVIYRSSRCGYTGPPVAKADDSPTNDPMQDVCGLRFSSCKLRNNTINFGGFPGARF